MTNDYTKSPVYEMVPTHCSCCNRPLVDATSVEYGVGPVCRKKYSYEDAIPVTPEIREAMVNVLSRFHDLAFGGRVMAAVDANDSRKAANLLNRLLAVSLKHDVSDVDVIVAIEALETLGYTDLANRVSSVIATVSVEEKAGKILVKVPFERAFVDTKVAGRHYNKPTDTWIVPAKSKKDLWVALQKAYSGKVGTGPKGMFVIP